MTMEGLAPSLLAQAVARAIDGWALGGLGVVAFVLLERRCTRTNHRRCAVRVLGTVVAAAILAALTPNLFESKGSPPDTIELPSRGAAVATAITVALLGRYGLRALPVAVVVPLAAAAWILTRTASVTAVATGLLIGAGTGMLVHAAVSHVAGPEPADPETRERNSRGPPSS
jgi:hypothetical protein